MWHDFWAPYIERARMSYPSAHRPKETLMYHTHKPSSRGDAGPFPRVKSLHSYSGTCVHVQQADEHSMDGWRVSLSCVSIVVAPSKPGPDAASVARHIIHRRTTCNTRKEGTKQGKRERYRDIPESTRLIHTAAALDTSRVCVVYLSICTTDGRTIARARFRSKLGHLILIIGWARGR